MSTMFLVSLVVGYGEDEIDYSIALFSSAEKAEEFCSKYSFEKLEGTVTVEIHSKKYECDRTAVMVVNELPVLA